MPAQSPSTDLSELEQRLDQAQGVLAGLSDALPQPANGSPSTFAAYREENLNPSIAPAGEVKRVSAKAGSTTGSKASPAKAPTKGVAKQTLQQAPKLKIVEAVPTEGLQASNATPTKPHAKGRPASARPLTSPSKPSPRKLIGTPPPPKANGAAARSQGHSDISASPTPSVTASVASTSVQPFRLSTTNMTEKPRLTTEEIRILEAKQRVQEEMKKFERIKEAEQKKKARPSSAPSRPIGPDPFPLESVRRHNAKMQQIMEQRAQEALELQKAREFVATPLQKVAKVVQQKHVPPKVERPTTVHKPFKIHTDARHKYHAEVRGPEKARLEKQREEEVLARLEEEQAREAEELKRLRQELGFKARKCTVTKAQPFQPDHSVAKNATRPVPFTLQTDGRMKSKSP